MSADRSHPAPAATTPSASAGAARLKGGSGARDKAALPCGRASARSEPTHWQQVLAAAEARA